MFLISCLASYSDGTHSLQTIHWWENYAKFLQLCSYILDTLGVSKFYIFGSLFLQKKKKLI